MAKRNPTKSPMIVDRRARSAMDSLNQRQKGRLHLLILQLLTKKPEKWPDRFVVKLDTTSATYVLRLSPDIRVIFEHPAPNKIRILDIVSRDTLEEFSGAMD